MDKIFLSVYFWCVYLWNKYFHTPCSACSCGYKNKYSFAPRNRFLLKNKTERNLVRGSRLYAITNDAPCQRRSPVYIVNLPGCARSWLVVVRSIEPRVEIVCVRVYIGLLHQSSPTIIIQGDVSWRERERSLDFAWVYFVLACILKMSSLFFVWDRSYSI